MFSTRMLVLFAVLGVFGIGTHYMVQRARRVEADEAAQALPLVPDTADLSDKTAAVPAKGGRTLVIGAWTHKPDGTLDQVYLTCQDKDDPTYGKLNAIKLLWMGIGHKKVIVPGYITIGAEAQKIKPSEVADAWQRKVPGVYRVDYSAPAVRNSIFKGMEVEVAAP